MLFSQTAKAVWGTCRDLAISLLQKRDHKFKLKQGILSFKFFLYFRCKRKVKQVLLVIKPRTLK